MGQGGCSEGGAEEELWKGGGGSERWVGQGSGREHYLKNFMFTAALVFLSAPGSSCSRQGTEHETDILSLC